MDMIKTLFKWLLIGGFLLAVLRIFNYDPFGVVQWLWDTFWTIEDKIAAWFTSQPWFHKAFSNPSK